MTAPRVLRTTPTGHVDEIERASIALHRYEQAVAARDTARIAVPGGEVHLDIYPAPDTAPVRGTVVFVGGLSAHALLYADFQHHLSERGWNVVALDVRGHGRSSGRRGDFTMEMVIEDMRATAAYARERFSGPLVLMGSSLGGFYALLGANAIEDFDLAVSHWIFLPQFPVTSKDARVKPVALLLNRLVPSLRISTKLVAEWDHVADSAILRQRCFDDPLMVWKYSVRALAGGIAYTPARPLTSLRCPHLVVIGTNDQMTPLAYTQRIFDMLEGDKKLVTIAGAGHMGGLVEHQDAMLNAVDGWLTERAKALNPPVANG
jgi:alpha-beta hydrolase superfamily lysophospholipase